MTSCKWSMLLLVALLVILTLRASGMIPLSSDAGFASGEYGDGIWSGK